MPTQPEPEVQHVRPFAEFLQAHDKGGSHASASAELHALIGAVQVHGKAGELVISVKVKPAGSKRNAEQVIVTVEVTPKPPKADPPASIFFVDREGNLTRNNPDQGELPLTVAGKEATQ